MYFVTDRNKLLSYTKGEGTRVLFGLRDGESVDVGSAAWGFSPAKVVKGNHCGPVVAECVEPASY